jgi:hypothetical protein
MKSFALAAAILLVGCTIVPAASDRDKKARALEERIGEIARRERHCVDRAISQTSDEIDRIGMDNEPFAEDRVRIAAEEGERKVSRCGAEASQENEEISWRERAEYQLRGEEERERSSLMMVLTTSRPR